MKNGLFSTSFKIDPVEYGVHVTARAQCDKWFGKIPVSSQGKAYFKIVPEEDDEQNIGSSDTNSDLQIENQPQEIIAAANLQPEGSLQLPDFRGATIRRRRRVARRKWFPILLGKWK